MKDNNYVFCFVFDKEGRVLVLRRADFMRARPGEWDLPGGKVDQGEKLEDAIAREVNEETGISIKNVELVKSSSGEWGGARHAFYYYRADMPDSKVVLSEEHVEAEWHEPLVAATMITFHPHVWGLGHA